MGGGDEVTQDPEHKNSPFKQLRSFPSISNRVIYIKIQQVQILFTNKFGGSYITVIRNK